MCHINNKWKRQGPILELVVSLPYLALYWYPYRFSRKFWLLKSTFTHKKTENPFADLCNKTEFLISPISVLQAWGHKKEINFWHENTPGWTLSNCSGFGWENYAKIICEHFLPSQNITRCKKQAKLSKILKNYKKNCTSNFWSVSNLQKIVFYVKIMTPFKVDENNCNRLSSYSGHILGPIWSQGFM